MRKFLFILSVTILSFLSSCKDESEPVLKFVFMGDLHYKIPDYRTADYLVPFFAKEIESVNPDDPLKKVLLRFDRYYKN